MAKDKPEKAMNKLTAPKRPESTGTKKEALSPVETLAETNGLLSWETAGLMKAAGWAQGKQVSEKQFQQALTKFRNRPQGGGRIKA
jgi:hypothetical protein